ncbi:MAG: Calx-beta domain-containing protein, partial [Bacteroidota bacterium]
YTFTPAANYNGPVPTVTYSISDGAATASANLDITVTPVDDLPTAYAGPDVTICAGDKYILAASSATNYVSLNWATSGTGSFDDENALHPTYAPSLADITSGTVTLTLTSTGYGITGHVSDIMVLTITQSPTVSNAGVNQNLFNQTNFTLAANIPTVGNGLWTLVSGANTPTFTASDPHTIVTNVIPGIYVFRWTISNGVCPPSASTVEINNASQPAISISDAIVLEGTPLLFYVVLSHASGLPVTVQFSTSDETATVSDFDYTGIPTSTLTFAPGETSKVITVYTTADTKYEVDETMLLNLVNPVNATILDPQGIGHITDNDNQPVITVSDPSVIEGGTLDFVISLSNPSYLPVTVYYSTADGTATTSNLDYTGITSTPVIFAPGETTKTIYVQTTADNIVEPDENMYLNLASPTNATIYDNQGLGTILNDDVAVLNVNNVTVTEGNTPGTVNAVFTVTMTNPAQSTIIFNYGMSDITAHAGLDYSAQSGTFTFLPGTTTATITVPITSDLIAEPTETYLVSLSGLNNAGLSVSIGTPGTCTILDDDAYTISLAGFTATEGDAGSA